MAKRDEERCQERKAIVIIPDTLKIGEDGLNSQWYFRGVPVSQGQDLGPLLEKLAPELVPEEFPDLQLPRTS